MLVGNTGVGKTVFIGNRLGAVSEDKLQTSNSFNYHTTSAVLQSKFHTDVRNLSSLNSSDKIYSTVITVLSQPLATASVGLGKVHCFANWKTLKVVAGKGEGGG